jgi:C-terminal peptidase prc
LTNLVLEQHVDPPSRQEMLLAGIKSVLGRAKGTVPVDLSRRVSQVTNEAQWTALLAELWPRADSGTGELEAALLSGLLEAAPGRPTLLSAEEYRAAAGFSGNRYVGTGVQIAYNAKEKLAQLMFPFRNGPTHRAGGRPGDLILEIDGENVHDVGLRRVVDLLRGEEGAPVTVVVRQPDSEERRTLRIVRGVAPIETVLGYARGNGDGWEFRPDPAAPVGYVAVGIITSGTLSELRVLEPKLKAAGARALVLDLRFASGENVHHAALLADALLDGGVMWRTRDAKGNTREFRADRDCLFRDWPLAVLVSAQSPPAGAWVAGALEDNGRAVLVGDTIVRQGYAKSFVPLPEGGAVEIPGEVVERSKQKPDADEVLERNMPSAWVIRPAGSVSSTPEQRAALQQWHSDKLRPEPRPGAGGESPQDPQLHKAIQVLQGELENGSKANGSAGNSAGGRP